MLGVLFFQMVLIVFVCLLVWLVGCFETSSYVAQAGPKLAM